MPSEAGDFDRGERAGFVGATLAHDFHASCPARLFRNLRSRTGQNSDQPRQHCLPRCLRNPHSRHEDYSLGQQLDADPRNRVAICVAAGHDPVILRIKPRLFGSCPRQFHGRTDLHGRCARLFLGGLVPGAGVGKLRHSMKPSTRGFQSSGVRRSCESKSGGKESPYKPPVASSMSGSRPDSRQLWQRERMAAMSTSGL